ncbi:dTMP kinase [Gleimia hominis]|uniref:Thymidylate kinase n=1 Tax=Gleimia hominis TaxID=595468 RepID=A0ABU3I981_9ACTO|nr:dTMP kinase [Gleimia hominis]MDT3766937.1 dTMP kinase [Gleimia hominis]
MGSGLFITFEGVDASGKTTQIERTAQWLGETLGVRVVTTREPGGTPLGQQIRELILHGPGDMDDRCEALLYAADRAYHVATKIRPALAAGQVVLQDRYLDSSVAYQGAARNLGVGDVRSLNTWGTQGLLPDVTVLLDVDPLDAARRRDGAQDRLELEGVAFQQAVREQYLQIKEGSDGRVKLVNAGEAPGAVQAQIRRVLTPVIEQWRRCCGVREGAGQ